jgi:hypothetical protein
MDTGLIIVIILLIVGVSGAGLYLMKATPKEGLTNEGRLYGQTLAQAGIRNAPFEPSYETRKRHAEGRTINENVEHFNSGHGFGTDQVGDRATDFDELLTKMGAGQDIIDSQAEFASGLTTQSTVGAALRLGDHESYAPVAWVGLRRPEAVPIGDPDQTPDLDISYFTDHKPLCF